MDRQCTTSIAIAGVLSILLSVCMVVFTTVIIRVCVRSKKQIQTEVCYDTINIGHQSAPPPAIETDINVAYGHTKST